MKYTIILILSFSSVAFTCSPQQVEFIGPVKSVMTEGNTCSFELDVDKSRFWPGGCPLDGPELRDKKIEVEMVNGNTCNLRAGKAISGVLSLGPDSKIVYNPL